MKLFLDSKTYVDTAAGLDISIPLSADPDSVRAWYCEPVRIEAVVTSQFVGDVNRGGSVNFRNVSLNPHGNGTHTECVGHISREPYTLNQCMREFHFKAIVLSVNTETVQNELFQQTDQVITRAALQKAWDAVADGDKEPLKALVIRTLANDREKVKHNYSNTNPPYLDTEAVEWILDRGIDHLVIDLPSVDRENDQGKLAAHHLFWDYPQNPQLHRTITELVFVPDAIKDGIYLLNIQITALENDASPSKLVLYALQRI